MGASADLWLRPAESQHTLWESTIELYIFECLLIGEQRRKINGRHNQGLYDNGTSLCPQFVYLTGDWDVQSGKNDCSTIFDGYVILQDRSVSSVVATHLNSKHAPFVLRGPSVQLVSLGHTDFQETKRYSREDSYEVGNDIYSLWSRTGLPFGFYISFGIHEIAL